MHNLFHNKGGWVNPETRDDSARSIRRDCRAVVVFGGLPPRPGGALPAAVEDAIAVSEWLVAHLTEPGGDERPWWLATAPVAPSPTCWHNT